MNELPHLLDSLPGVAAVTLVVVFLLIVLQEAVNGFHDAANAVATVIYSNSMKPARAIWLSAAMNFLGVLFGGTAVAFGMVFLLPKGMVAGIDTAHEASLMLALVVTAVGWNMATWWFGIPNSTTHTYIGSILGVSLAHAIIVGDPIAEAINWVQGEKILITLLVSPVFGFLAAWLIYKIVKATMKDPRLYEPHQAGMVPPASVQYPLIGGLVGVSFLHGSNDGQKSIGLMLMVLMGLMPGQYAIDPAKDPESYRNTLRMSAELRRIAGDLEGNPATPRAGEIVEELGFIEEMATRDFERQPLSEAERIQFRSNILDVHEVLGRTLKRADSHELLAEQDIAILRDAYGRTTKLIEHVPLWLIVLSALALGCGTMVGYRKIVQTLGEKMGDKHMSAAQGLAAQAATMVSIGAADCGGVPVSTTHVLTAGVAGGVQSSGDRVQWNTIGRILITWFTTLPGTLILACVLGIAFHAALA